MKVRFHRSEAVLTVRRPLHEDFEAFGSAVGVVAREDRHDLILAYLDVTSLLVHSSAVRELITMKKCETFGLIR